MGTQEAIGTKLAFFTKIDYALYGEKKISEV
jgi:hypothetical protein